MFVRIVLEPFLGNISTCLCVHKGVNRLLLSRQVSIVTIVDLNEVVLESVICYFHLMKT